MANSEILAEIYSTLEPYLSTTDEASTKYARILVKEKRNYLNAFIKKIPFPPFEVEVQMSSNCNLQCSWCIGDEVQQDKKVLNLPNRIRRDNEGCILDGIIDCEIGGLKIESVKFSGFIGEQRRLFAATVTQVYSKDRRC